MCMFKLNDCSTQCILKLDVYDTVATSHNVLQTDPCYVLRHAIML